MIFFQALLVLAFLAVAAWLDRENRRVNAALTSVTAENERLRAALADTELAVEGLEEELVAYRNEDAERSETRRVWAH